MWAVSHLWWEALDYRKYIERLLKRSFKQVCHPFECSPQHVTSRRIEGGQNVCGVAVNYLLHVKGPAQSKCLMADHRSVVKKISKYKGWKIQMTLLYVASRVNSILRNTDYKQRAICRVMLLSNEPADKFITIQWKPRRLSVNSCRLLIFVFWYLLDDWTVVCFQILGLCWTLYMHTHRHAPNILTAFNV